MKTIWIGLSIALVLGATALAFAHGPGWGGGYMGYMMGPGYGNHMMDWGYSGGPMMGWTRQPADQKFLDETADLRKELNTKRFEYFEAIRKPDVDTDTVAKLENEVETLQRELYDKFPGSSYGPYARYGGGCW